MKKLLLSVVAVSAAFTMNAQLDTLTEFFTGTPTLYGSTGGGYVSGNNGYGDLGKYMRFDNTMGITGDGTLIGAVLWLPAKNDNGGSFDVVVREFNAGTLGNTLASETFTLASVDTATAALMVAEGAVGYNLAVTFSTPVAVTSASDIVVGIELPTTAGDSIALISNTDGDFAGGDQYTWDLWSDNTFTAVADPSDWGLFIAFGVHPVIDFVAGVTENSIEVSVYPNPANDVLNFNLKGEANSITIITLDGKVVATQSVNGATASVNVANLATGAYIYEVSAADGSVIRDTFVKK